MSSRLQICLDNIQMIDPGGKLCRAEVCMSAPVTDLLNRICDCVPPFPPVNPCPYPPGTPIATYDETTNELCYCCCDVPMEVAAGEAGEVDVSGVWVGHMVRVAKRAN